MGAGGAGAEGGRHGVDVDPNVGQTDTVQPLRVQLTPPQIWLQSYRRTRHPVPTVTNRTKPNRTAFPFGTSFICIAPCCCTSTINTPPLSLDAGLRGGAELIGRDSSRHRFRIRRWFRRAKSAEYAGFRTVPMR